MISIPFSSRHCINYNCFYIIVNPHKNCIEKKDETSENTTNEITLYQQLFLMLYMWRVFSVYGINFAQIRLGAHKITARRNARVKLREINPTNYANRGRRIMSSSGETLANSVLFEKLLVRHE